MNVYENSLKLLAKKMLKLMDKGTNQFYTQKSCLCGPMRMDTCHEVLLIFKIEQQIKWITRAQYPQHHVTYAPAKFEVIMSKGLEDAFKRKYSI